MVAFGAIPSRRLDGKASNSRWTVVFSRATCHVWVHFALISASLCTFTAVLVGLVYWYSWNANGIPASVFEGRDLGFASNVITVDLSSTRLILVASWSSSVALPLIGSLMSISSYIIAADLIWISKRSLSTLLPSPEQLGLLTDLLDGKKMAIFTWLLRITQRHEKRSTTRWIIEFPIIVQLSALALSVAIMAADTWLHVESKSVTMPFLARIPTPEEMGSCYFYSRNLTSMCLNSSNICSVVERGGRNETAFESSINALLSPGPLLDTVINSSTKDRFSFLAPRAQPQNLFKLSDHVAVRNFTADTFSASAVCGSQICTTHTPRKPWDLSCDVLNVSLSKQDWLAIGPADQGSYEELTNKYRYSPMINVSVAILLENTTIQYEKGGQSNNSGTETEQGGPPDSTAFVINCTVTVNSASYEWTDETFEPNPVFATSLAAARVVRAPFLTTRPKKVSGVQANVFRDKLAMRPSGVIQEIDLSTVSGNIEKALSYFMLAQLGGAIQAEPPRTLTVANSTIVTQVGKAPLFALVMLNMWYVGFGGLLFGLALYVLHDEDTSQDIVKVQKLISVAGLATAAVRRHRDNLATHDTKLRVGVEKLDGEWQFVVFEVEGNSEEKRLLVEEIETDEVVVP